MAPEHFLEFMAWLRMRYPGASADLIRDELPRIERYLKTQTGVAEYLDAILQRFELNLWSGWMGRSFDEITVETCRAHQMRLLSMAASETIQFMDGTGDQARRADRPPVSVIIPAWNQWSFTRQTLETLFEKTAWPEFEVIVVDNASEDETARGLTTMTANHSRLRVITNFSNLGFSGANNLGADGARFDHLIFLNNDMVIHHADWIGQMMRSFLSHPSVGAAGQFGVIDCFSGEREELYQHIYFPGVTMPVSWISGYNVLTTKEILAEAGGWRGDLYGAAGHEDIHLGYAIRGTGRICASPAEMPGVLHLIGRTRFTDAGRAFVAAHSPAENKHAIFRRHFSAGRRQQAA